MHNLTEILIQHLNRCYRFESGSIDMHFNALIAILEEFERIESIGGWYFDADSEQIFWTRQTYEIYGLEPDIKITPEIGISFYASNAQRQIAQLFNELLTSKKPYKIELPFVNKKGEYKWVRTSGKAFEIEGKVKYLYGAFEDITEEKQLARFLGEKQLNYEAILDNANDCIVTIDQHGVILSCSTSVESVFGYQKAELTGQNVSMLMPEHHARKHDAYMSHYLATGHAKIIGIGRELPARKKDGSAFPMELSLSEAVIDSEPAFIGIIKDITERRESEKRLNQLAFYDAATGLLNNISLERDVDALLSATHANAKVPAILVFDLDHFRQIELVYGRPAGDGLIKTFAARLKNTFSDYGDVYRHSRDKFYVLISDLNKYFSVNAKGYKTVLEKICHSINVPLIYEGTGIEYTFSSVCLVDGLIDYTTDNLFTLLESSLLLLIKQGGNQFRWISKDDIKVNRRQNSLLRLLKQAETQNEIQILLQPQFDSEHNIVCSEVLARWQNASFGMVSPAEFIPMAEETGEIIRLGFTVIELAARAYEKAVRETGKATRLAINISARQLATPDFEYQLCEILSGYNVSFDDICLEVTESLLIDNKELMASKMHSLTAKGFTFSIDDFGTGYSSLSYIKTLPIHELKIDKTFIDDIQSVDDEVPIVNAVFNLASSFGLNVVAEGVEDKAQSDYIWSKGEYLIQGYYFSRPLNVADWITQLKANRECQKISNCVSENTIRSC